MPMLGIVDFSYNQLTAISPLAFLGLIGLPNINLSGNKITYIPNFNLSRTGLGWNNPGPSTSSNLQLSMYQNPIQAIDPLLMPSLYNSGRVLDPSIGGPFDIYFYPYEKTTCVDPNLKTILNFPGDLFIIGNLNNQSWTIQDSIYQQSTTCYSAFTSQMASGSLVTCDPTLTTTTVSTSTTLAPSVPSQCATDKICRYYLDWNNQYTCVIDGAEGTVTSITGTHYLTYTNADVKRVYFINSHLSLVPKILFQTFPNLKFLHTANSGMTVINDQTFNECGVLELWDASDNDISRVDETSLRNCTNLRIIDLTGNPIDFVSQGLYQLDPALERIHLTRLDDWTLA